ncbi:MAG: heme ABC transporter ATP-binding protein [Marinibacterium sp.]|nr:heme ABC transporter ATP-binding protein [Marinibacterium sp.]
MIARDIHVEIGGKPVIRGVDFNARSGEVTAIIGPNGSGKSTLLRALTGEIPARGRMSLNCTAIAATPAWELAAIRAVQAQSTTVAFPFEVDEIVRLGHAAGLAAGDPSVPARALAEVGLSGFGHRPYHGLSGGEQQRVHLARALAQVWPVPGRDTPRWLFLDEPVSSLDIGHQLMVIELLQRFARDGGGVVAVMHDLNLTAMFADRVVLLRDGRVLADAPPADTLTTSNISRAYNCPLRMGQAAGTGLPALLPQDQMRA